MSRDLIFGAGGMLGSALARLLPDANTTARSVDLTNPNSVYGEGEGADNVYLCAARVGGLGYNLENAWDMIADNIEIQANVIRECRHSVSKLIWIGSSCMYPAKLLRDMREDQIYDGPPESTNAPYAHAKRAGLAMLQASGIPFLAVIPCNLYGPGDRFALDRAHFLPAMIRRFHEAKVSGAQSVTLMGDGTPRRELMHVDDAARIIVKLAKDAEENEIINIGPGVDKDIAQWASIVASVVGYAGEIKFDGNTSRNGVQRKLLDVSRMKQHWVCPEIPYRDGIAATYKWFLEQEK